MRTDPQMPLSKKTLNKMAHNKKKQNRKTEK